MFQAPLVGNRTFEQDMMLDFAHFEHVRFEAPSLDTAQFGRASCCVRLCHIWAGGFSSPTSAKQNPPVEQGSMLHITLNDHVCFKPPLWETWYSWWSECNLNFTLLGHVCLKPPWWGTGCSCRATYHVRLYPIRTCVCQVPWWGT